MQTGVMELEWDVRLYTLPAMGREAELVPRRAFRNDRQAAGGEDETRQCNKRCTASGRLSGRPPRLGPRAQETDRGEDPHAWKESHQTSD